MVMAAHVGVNSVATIFTDVLWDMNATGYWVSHDADHDSHQV